MLWLLLAIAVYVLVLLAVVWVSVRPPRIPIFLSPGGMGAPQEDVEFRSDDGTLLRGWWIPAEKATGVAVLCHGYLMNRSELAPVAWMLQRRGVSCLLFDFRAHGRSGGRTTTMGVREAGDVAAAARFARDRCAAPLVLIGSSMGAAASAFALAADSGLAEGLVLDSCYSRLPSASLGWWRFLGGKPLAFAFAPTILLGIPFLRSNPFRVDVAKALRKIPETPVLMLHGDRDTLALPSEALRNRAAHAGGSDIVWLAGCGHAEGRWIHPDLYHRALLGFLGENGLLPEALG